LYRRRNLLDGAVLPHSAAEHRAILKAIASGDAEQAGRAMYEHVIESKERALRAVSYPQSTRARAGRKG
jgi:DNA-binding FadR family transcriptional regulator